MQAAILIQHAQPQSRLTGLNYYSTTRYYWTVHFCQIQILYRTDNSTYSKIILEIVLPYQTYLIVLSGCCRNFNQNLVRPRTNTEVEEFKKKKKGKKAPAGDDNLGRLPLTQIMLLVQNAMTCRE